MTSRAVLVDDAARALARPAPLQLYGARGTGKTWILERALERIPELAGARRASIDLERWVTRSDPEAALRDILAVVATQLEGRIEPADDPKAVFESLLRAVAGPTIVIVEGAEHFGSPVGKRALDFLTDVASFQSNMRPPYGRLRLVLVARAPFAAVNRAYEPYALARTRVIDVPPIEYSDACELVTARGWRLGGGGDLDDLLWVMKTTTGGWPLLIAKMADASSSTDVDRLIDTAHRDDGPLRGFFVALRSAIAERDGAATLIRALVNTPGVHISPEDRVFLSGWGLISPLGTQLEPQAPALTRWVRSTLR